MRLVITKPTMTMMAQAPQVTQRPWLNASRPASLSNLATGELVYFTSCAESISGRMPLAPATTAAPPARTKPKRNLRVMVMKSLTLFLVAPRRRARSTQRVQFVHRLKMRGGLRLADLRMCVGMGPIIQLPRDRADENGFGSDAGAQAPGFIGDEKHHDEIIALEGGIIFVAIEDAGVVGGFPLAGAVEGAERLAAEKHGQVRVALQNLIGGRFNHAAGVTPLSKCGIGEDGAEAITVELFAGEFDHPLIDRRVADEHLFIGEDETDGGHFARHVVPALIGFAMKERPLNSLIGDDLPREFARDLVFAICVQLLH